MANEELIYRITRAVYGRLGASADERMVEQLVTDVYRAIEPVVTNGGASGRSEAASTNSREREAREAGSAERLIVSVFGVDHPGIVAGVSQVLAEADCSIIDINIVGKSVEVIAKMAGLSVPSGTRCLVADVGGVGRDYPLSMEKLSPILAFYVEDGIERGAARCFEVLSYGGMGHTAGVHTRSREAAVAYGREMPASRVIVNSPTTHGAIGFSTALPPSMTLGCGSWGGNVTSDNVSPLHLMDIKRVAFETRPVKSARPALATQKSTEATSEQPAVAASSAPPRTIGRKEISDIVDRFLAGRGSGQPAHAELHPTTSPMPAQPVIDIEAGSRYAAPSAAPHAEAAPTAVETGGNGNTSERPTSPPPAAQPAAAPAPAAQANGGQAATNGNARKPVDFVSEDDVRRAIQKGEKIYVNARTIITPSARDMGEPAEVFAKG